MIINATLTQEEDYREGNIGKFRNHLSGLNNRYSKHELKSEY